ncbi:MAG: DNA circularization N-terminal domain-containing protein [Synergistaceae bacterium]|nr:DNA circularization N-terminal domain-containing protein [Synergistaceae bacterium]
MWKDNLREASFRGVPFFYDSTGIDGGRRTQTHEFAYRDKPYTEDLGRKAQEIPIEAYVLGDDYMTARDNLLKACNEEGPGELIHPYYGSIQVNCQVISVRESTSEGRIARISLQFIEAGEKFFPDSSPDRSAAVTSAVEKLNKSSAEDFARTFTIEGAPEFIGVQAVADIINFINTFSLSENEDLKTSVPTLLRQTEALAEAIQGVLSELVKSETETEKNNALKTLIEACSYGKRIDNTSGSVTQARLRSNSNAIVDLIRHSAASAAAEVAINTDFKTRNEAETVRDKIADSLDQQSEITESTPLYISLTDMRSALVQAIPEEGLPELISVNVNHPVPSLVLAYELYEDALKGDEIVTRNRIRHPGFIGPAEVQVVSEVVS